MLIKSIIRTLCVAPMMEWTDRHCRYFLRLITRHALLYTEMVTTGAIIHGNRGRLLGRHEAEHPVALQLGGSDPLELARCARIGVEWGYDEINLNVGCPSDRVQSGRFGACLMGEPDLVGDCVAAMRNAVEVPVSVKCRIGIDQHEHYEDLLDFVADKNVHKQGRYMPGVHVPIVAAEKIAEEQPDYVLLLPWNLETEILAQEQAFRDKGGKFIIPVPEPRIV